MFELIASPSQQAFLIAFRLERCLRSGLDRSGATGFLFEYDLFEDHGIIVVVTAGHCLDGTQRLTFKLPRLLEEAVVDPSDPIEFMLAISDFLRHPDPQVDICIAPLGSRINISIVDGKRPLLQCWQLDGVISAAKLLQVKWLEDVYMVGCPFRIYDDLNLLPIARRASTATPLQSDYKGEKAFLLDVHMHKGSSGSPVSLIQEGQLSFPGGRGQLGGTRTALLGIAVAELLNPADDTELGLAKCLKSELLFQFVPELLARNPGYRVKPQWAHLAEGELHG